MVTRPPSVDKSDHTDQTFILSPSLLLQHQPSPPPPPPVSDDINILDVLLVVDGHRYILCDIESQRPEDTAGK